MTLSDADANMPRDMISSDVMPTPVPRANPCFSDVTDAPGLPDLADVTGEVTTPLKPVQLNRDAPLARLGH